MVRIGVLGASGIAPQALIRPVRRRQAALAAAAGVELSAVGARSAERAAAYASTWGFSHSYGSYDGLLADPEVDLVYNSLPPSEHARWTIAALEAGKHVLCEKPFTMNASEARAVTETAERTGRRVVEAFHDVYHPLSTAVREAAGPLGRLTRVDVEFSATIPFDPRSIRHDPAVGGGALMDLGCYCVHELRHFFGTEPEVVSAQATLNELGADMTIEAVLSFPTAHGPVAATLRSSMEPEALVSSLHAEGEHGVLDAASLVFAHQGHSIRTVVDGLERRATVAGRETYDHQLDALLEGLSSGASLLTEGADSVANMTVIDAIYAAAGIDR